MSKRTLVTLATVMAAIFLLPVAIAGATPPGDDGEHKIWICHVVNGQGELKNGYNLIEVDVAAADGEGRRDHTQHVANDGRRDLIPAPNRQCEVPVPTTTTEAPTTTVPDTTVPDTTVPDTTVPDTTVPDTTVPDTTVPSDDDTVVIIDARTLTLEVSEAAEADAVVAEPQFTG